jgi:hypothetical protein
MILEIALAILGCCFAVSVYYCFKFAMTILRVQEAVEASLDVIEERHQKISEILTRPLFFENAEVRQVLDDIEGTRTAIHEIAYSLSENFKAGSENE